MRKGFTIIELLILLAIVGILAAIAGPAVCSAVLREPAVDNSRGVRNAQRQVEIQNPGTAEDALANAKRFGEKLGYKEASCTKARSGYTCVVSRDPNHELMIQCPGHPGATCEPL